MSTEKTHITVGLDAVACAELEKMTSSYERLALAASSLYFAGIWTREGSTDREADSALWAELRDALGLKPGIATAAGKGQP